MCPTSDVDGGGGIAFEKIERSMGNDKKTLS
jgi:hypothetical protein